ncbi:threonyl-tRNA synthetase editing domain-containing protein [Thermodesulfatator atlanticus]|uniref:threonyl-tRNA synthetase editing domain-containing protein n=1 Tax=Thermodesulfatator atlanticus TaxID=501497 RepID=UPI0003B3D2D9|nr:threonyl-tRNA synthetase editing domain-containing protein [Thermodesulfatator atlanticus]
MKILMFYAPEFWWKPYQKVLPQAEEGFSETTVKNAVVVFYQVEEEDPAREKKVVEKLVKNIKWLARKFDTKNIVLHSFNHLSVSKASPEEGLALINKAKEKLLRAGFNLYETPFGWLNEWKMHVAGESLAKVFKDL